MSTNISRRKVVAGAAWAAPVVAASAAVPAFASSTVCEYASAPKFNISGQPSGAKNTQKFTVPAKVDKIRFEVAGGAGGGSASVAGGSGALVTGEISVKEGQVIELVAASGGVAYLESVKGVDSPSLWQTRPATGGQGYGNGGDVNEQSIPADAKALVDANWSKPSDMKRALYGGSGGGSSALVIDGTPVAVAGGGGGAGIRTQPGTNNVLDKNSKYFNSKAVDAGTTTLGDTAVKSVLPAGASASAAVGDTAETSVSHYTVLKPYTTDGTAMKVAGGNGGGNGQGGAGGEKPLLYSKANVYGVLGFTSQNKQELFSSSTAGDTGGSGFDGKGADGVFAYSYQVDNNDISKLETIGVTNPSGTTAGSPWLAKDSTLKSFNGYQTVVSAGGGAGYGGGGSGAARSLSSIITSQKWNGNTLSTAYRQDVGALVQAGAGGAGGSYVASSVAGGSIASANNATKQSGTRNPGYVKVTLCERS
ncbi:transcriptional initiation protein Tat [uncultured Rothia sp.]|uniref:transcriptional initiation protein Tat n=1 Tax=uncultured Rothia sp. TaxID=316088 RepID=UPI0025E97B70|nr:transcriptional initiation protein Tat [uncultured Rothia sp.]